MLSGRRRRPAVGAAVALACSAWLCSVTSQAQSTSDDLARLHFDSGVAYLEESDYDNALKAFQKAYELSKRPEILLNIATVRERQGALPAAASPAPRAAPSPSAAKAPAKAEPNRLPALISLGVGGVLAGASLATGLIAKAKYDDAESSCSPHCRDSQLSGSRTFAITSTVLTGAAVLGVGLGVALLLTTSGDDDAELGKNAPRFDVALGPTAAAASAAWSF